MIDRAMLWFFKDIYTAKDSFGNWTGRTFPKYMNGSKRGIGEEVENEMRTNKENSTKVFLALWSAHVNNVSDLDLLYSSAQSCL